MVTTFVRCLAIKAPSTQYVDLTQAGSVYPSLTEETNGAVNVARNDPHTEGFESTPPKPPTTKIL
jgi:hypothetical protein